MKTIILDANVIIRFLLADHPQLSRKAKEFFQKAEEGKILLYIDEVVAAETVWVLTSFYKVRRVDVVHKLEAIFVQEWMVNPRKHILQEALTLFGEQHIAYIDAWILAVSHAENIPLATFDTQLAKLASQHSV